jgi:hypothetical protein
MEDNSDNFHPVMARMIDTDTTTVVMWPSAFVGPPRVGAVARTGRSGNAAGHWNQQGS